MPLRRGRCTRRGHGQRAASVLLCVMTSGLFLAACGATHNAHAGSFTQSSGHRAAITTHGSASQPITTIVPTTTLTVPTTTTVLPTTTPATTAPPPATTAPPSVGHGYLASNASGVSFLQFSEGPGGSLTGSIYDDSLSGSPPDESVSTESNSFSGSVAGHQLTLNFEGQSTAVFGELKGDAIELELLQSDGSLAEVTFAEATPGDYDEALGALQQRASTDNQSVIAPTDPAALCSQDCPPLPSVPSGYYSVGVFSPSSPSDLVNFAQRPLQVCYAVTGSVSSLAYEIGSPSGGPTTLYQSGSSPSGCVADNGSDSGLTDVAITATGSGMWLVQIDEATVTEVSVLQQQAQVQQQEEQAIDQAAGTVQSDVQTLTGDDPNTLGDDVNSLGDDLNTVNNDLGSEQNDYGSFQNDLADNNDACGDISGLDQDAQTVAGDGQTLWNDSHSGLLEDITSFQRDMATARADWAAYENAQAVLPGYQTANSVPPLSSTLATAQAAINNSINQANSDIDQVNPIIAQAYALANKADQTGHCGHPASVPPALKHIAPAS